MPPKDVILPVPRKSSLHSPRGMKYRLQASSLGRSVPLAMRFTCIWTFGYFVVPILKTDSSVPVMLMKPGMGSFTNPGSDDELEGSRMEMFT